jgi:hypothetical protein
VNGLTLFAINGSWMAGMAVGGYLIEGLGYTIAFDIMMALYLVTAVVFFALFGRGERSQGNGLEDDPALPAGS